MKRPLTVATLLMAIVLLCSCASSRRRPRSYGKRRGYHAPSCNCGKKRFIVAPQGDVYYNAGFRKGFH